LFYRKIISIQNFYDKSATFLLWMSFCYFYHMEVKNQLKLTQKTLQVPVFFVISIWFIYLIELQYNLNFNKWGIYPRTLKGLRGVLFAPFIHANLRHLFNNSIPLFVLLLSISYFYKEVALKVLIIGGFLTGFLTWVFARESYHIGASGIVYLLFSFVFFSGIIKKHYRLIALSLVIIFLYGSMIWYVFPIEDTISWEGHLSGFFVGIFFAFYYKNKGIIKEEFQYSPSSFDELFDKEGNLISIEIEETLKEEPLEKNNSRL